MVVAVVLGLFCLILAVAIHGVVQTTATYKESLLEMIERIGSQLEERNIELLFANIRGPIRDL